ncbi:hypothetical protein ACFVWY_05735 [Streptomyces sp. NPDC058195]
MPASTSKTTGSSIPASSRTRFSQADLDAIALDAGEPDELLVVELLC